MILAIGFRVRSQRGTQFRIWANRHFQYRSHALRGNASGDAQRQETVGAERHKTLFPRGAWEQ